MYKYLFKWMTFRQKGFTQRKARLEAFAKQPNSLLPMANASKPPRGDKPRTSSLLTPNPEDVRRLRMSMDSLDMSYVFYFNIY